jgi:hypothetical protein
MSVPQSDYSAGMKDSFYYTREHFSGLYLLETRAWKDAESLPLDPQAPPDLAARWRINPITLGFTGTW